MPDAPLKSSRPASEPLFPLPPRRGLGVEELHRLYAVTDWRPMLFVDAGREGRFAAIALMKAFVLPYLVPIPT